MHFKVAHLFIPNTVGFTFLGDDMYICRKFVLYNFDKKFCDQCNYLSNILINDIVTLSDHWFGRKIEKM